MNGRRTPPSTIGRDERVARAILRERDVRADQTVRPDAFIPPSNLELSTTRHWNLTPEELWGVCGMIAVMRDRPLIGRADIQVSDIERYTLQVQAAPLSDNPNHANVVGWPTDKAAQKALAQELASVAAYVGNPARV